MSVLYGHDQAVADWVGGKLGKPFSEPFKAIGVIDGEGTLTGGFVFTVYTGPSISLSLAGRGVSSREAWRAVLAYVFDDLDCSRLECRTSAKNKIVRKSLPRLGFKFEGTARRLFGKDDGLVFSLIADELAAFRTKWRL